MRTKHQVHLLCGHEDAVSSILTHSVDPQVVTGSFDSTIKVKKKRKQILHFFFNIAD